MIDAPILASCGTVRKSCTVHAGSEKECARCGRDLHKDGVGAAGLARLAKAVVCMFVWSIQR